MAEDYEQLGGFEEDSDSVDGLLEQVKSIIFYRKWVIILVSIIAIPVLLFAGLKIPNKYRVRTTILVIPQKVSSDYVTPIIPLSSRLKTITQEIMSRNRILRLMTELGMVKKIKTQGEIEKRIIQIRAMIDLRVMESKESSSFEIVCTGKEPKVIRDVANTAASIFIDETLKRNFQQARTTTQFLDDELIAIRTELEVKEKEVSDFKRKHLGELPQQQDALLSTLNRLQGQIQSINDILLETEKQKKMLLGIREQALDEQKSREQKERISGIDTLEYSLGPMASSQERALAGLQKRLEDLKIRYSDAWPEVVRIKKKIFDAENTLRREDSKKQLFENKKKTNDASSQKMAVKYGNSKAVNSIENNLKSITIKLEELLAKRKKLEKLYSKVQRRVENIPSRGIALTKLSRDYNIIQGTYQSLLRKKMDAQLSENLVERQQGERFTILDSAVLPTSPYFPKFPMILGGSVGGGVLLGIGFAILLTVMDSSFRNVSELKHRLGYHVIASIPHITKKDFPKLSRAERKTIGKVNIKFQHNVKLIAFLSGESHVQEEYKNFRAHLFNYIKPKGCRVIAVSSTTAGEGKSLTSANLALAISKGVHESVLLIDADMKRPTLHEVFQVDMSPGLSDYLDGSVGVQSLFRKTNYDKLSIVTAGSSSSHSSELMDSEKMRLLLEDVRNRYEDRYVIVDLPPLLPVSDVLNIAKHVDGLLFVVSAGNVPQRMVKKAIEKYPEKNIIGVVFNNYKGMALEFPQMYRAYYKRY